MNSITYRPIEPGNEHIQSLKYSWNNLDTHDKIFIVGIIGIMIIAFGLMVFL